MWTGSGHYFCRQLIGQYTSFLNWPEQGVNQGYITGYGHSCYHGSQISRNVLVYHSNVERGRYRQRRSDFSMQVASVKKQNKKTKTVVLLLLR